MQKFFAKNKQINIEEKIAYIAGEDVNHIKNVLRYKIGDKIQIGNINTNKGYNCEIIRIENMIECKILEEIEGSNEALLHINIIQGLPKSDKMELIIQKCTELGVKEFTPLEMSRCIVKLDKKDEKKKIERWQKIAEVAAKQCKRNTIPKINELYNLKNIFEILKEYDIVLLAYENEKNNGIKDEIEKLKDIKDKTLKIAVIIGPEGGLDEKEVELLKQNGAKIVTLGNRILRTETVGFVVASILMYELGDLG